jgi:hypothetical protein
MWKFTSQIQYNEVDNKILVFVRIFLLKMSSLFRIIVENRVCVSCRRPWLILEQEIKGSIKLANKSPLNACQEHAGLFHHIDEKTCFINRDSEQFLTTSHSLGAAPAYLHSDRLHLVLLSREVSVWKTEKGIKHYISHFFLNINVIMFLLPHCVFLRHAVLGIKYCGYYQNSWWFKVCVIHGYPSPTNSHPQRIKTF